MFGFIKRLFGGRSSAPLNSDPFSRNAQPPATGAPELAPPRRASPPIVLQRDEIIDARTRLGGYRFSARRPGSARQADALSTVEALSANNVAAFAERRLALIPIHLQDWLSHDHRPLIGPNTVFLLAPPEQQTEFETWSEVAGAIHRFGARLAMPGSSMTAHRALIREHADFLLLDFSAYTLVNFEQAIKTLKAGQPKLELIAENVGRWPEHRYCIAHGVHYCIGPFTTEQDEEQQPGEIGQSRLVLIEMLNHLRHEADLADIAEVAKRDPGVVVKLIAMTNSPLLGLSQTVTSIDQAIMILGREQLYRWISIGMFRTGSTSPRDEVLLELALARGRFLEGIGQHRHGKPECDELFLLGLLSLLDCLLGIPMAAVVERIHLSSTLKDVLLNSSGPFGRYLMLAIAVEKGSADQVARLAEQLGIDLGSIEAASAEAVGWAEEAARLSA